MAVDINSCLSSDLISLRSIPKPIGRTDQLSETGAAAIEPGVDADGAGPPAEIAVPIWPRCTPDFRGPARGNRPDIERHVGHERV